MKKETPNTYVGTTFGELVDAAGHDEVVITGFMTNTCVQFTAQGTFLHGKKPTVAANISATHPLETEVSSVLAEQPHYAALSIISDQFGVVVLHSKITHRHAPILTGNTTVPARTLRAREGFIEIGPDRVALAEVSMSRSNLYWVAFPK